MTDNSNRPANEFLTTSIQRLGSSSHGYEPSISPAHRERSTSLTPAVSVSVESSQISRQFSLLRGDRKGAIHSLRRYRIKIRTCRFSISSYSEKREKIRGISPDSFSICILSSAVLSAVRAPSSVFRSNFDGFPSNMVSMGTVSHACACAGELRGILCSMRSIPEIRSFHRGLS